MPLTTLNPVFGFNADGSFQLAPIPSILQFAGVPPLPGGFGARIGIGGGGVDINASAGIGLPFTGISGTTGSGLTTTGTTLGGSLTDGYSPYGLAMGSSLTPPLTEDQPGGLFKGDQWGIFDSDMNRVAPWDSVVKLDYRHEMKISDFPVERGAFASYNKVQVPFDIRVSFAIGGGAGGGKTGIAGREQFLAQIEFAVKSLQMYTVITPEAYYPEANLIHMEYSRESRRGLNLLVVEVWVQEVRPTAGSAFTTNTAGKTPTYLDPINNGPLQAKPVGPTGLLTNDFIPNTGVDAPPPGMPVSSATSYPGNSVYTPTPGLPSASTGLSNLFGPTGSVNF